MKQTKLSKQNTAQIGVDTPIGTLIVSAENGAVTAITLAQEEVSLPTQSESEPVLNRAAEELNGYFAGKRKTFSFAMRPEGTAFQKSVWNALLNIPCGETKSYGQIAAEVGNPKGARAVGMACNKNPIMIAVPCHRVLGASGSLTGYALGTEVKRTLLEHEKTI